MYSYSAINTFLHCPHRFKLKYIDKIEVEKKEIMLIGEKIHKILERFLREGDLNKIDEIIDRELAELDLNIDDEKEIKENVLNYLSGKEFAKDYIVGIEEKIAIDKNKNIVDWRDEDVFFRGKIDLLYRKNSTVKIVDFKTGYDLKTPKLQLEIYAWLVNCLYPEVQNFQIVYDFINFCYDKEFLLQKKDIAKIEKKIMNLIEMIENEKEYPAKMSSECYNCEYQCEKYQEIKFNETPEELLKKYILLEQELARIEEILREYCKNNKIRVNDMVAEIKGVVSYKYNIREILKECDEKGIDIIDCLSIDNRKLNAELKRKIDLPDIIEKNREPKIYTRFVIGKEKEGEKDV